LPDLSAAVKWTEIEALWDSVGGDCPEEVIGEYRLLLAKATHPAVKAAADYLQPAEPLWDHGTRSRDGIVIAEVSPRDDARVKRRLVLLARSGNDTALSAWA
jgi:CASPASE and TPR Repeat-Associated N-terminal domain